MADQWDKTLSDGSDLISTIDNTMQENNAALDRLVIGYRVKCTCQYSSATQFTVSVGEIAIPDSGETVVRWRRTTTATTVTWADLDTGAEATSTTYYIYAVADTDITGFTVVISANSSTPQGGETYYRKIGSFYNNADGDISSVKNEDGIVEKEAMIKGWVTLDGSATLTISDSFNVASVTDNGTGDYTVTWDTDFANANYALGLAVRRDATHTDDRETITPYGNAVGSVSVYIESDGGSAHDCEYVSIIAIGDQ